MRPAPGSTRPARGRPDRVRRGGPTPAAPHPPAPPPPAPGPGPGCPTAPRTPPRRPGPAHRRAAFEPETPDAAPGSPRRPNGPGTRCAGTRSGIPQLVTIPPDARRGLDEHHERVGGRAPITCLGPAGPGQARRVRGRELNAWYTPRPDLGRSISTSGTGLGLMPAPRRRSDTVSGSRSPGPATVASSVATYTPATTALNPSGVPVGGTVATANVKQFKPRWRSGRQERPIRTMPRRGGGKGRVQLRPW